MLIAEKIHKEFSGDEPKHLRDFIEAEMMAAPEWNFDGLEDEHKFTVARGRELLED